MNSDSNIIHNTCCALTLVTDFEDFDNTTIFVTFQPDEIGQQMDDVNTPVPMVDDVINEADEQNFVVTVEVVDAFNTSRISIEREDSLCRIIDDDGEC